MILISTASVTSLFARLFDSIGTSQFDLRAMDYLSKVAGVDHFTVYRRHNNVVDVIGGRSVLGRHFLYPEPPPTAAGWRPYCYFRAVQAVSADLAAPVMVQIELHEVGDRQLQHGFARFAITDCALVAGKRNDDWYVASLLRAAVSGRFRGSELSCICEIADLLISVVAKHESLRKHRVDINKEFGSVEVIEERLTSADLGLSAREMQVCARVLYGLCVAGIALDLDIREDTVNTYRKRGYRRLGVGSRNELFHLYLSLL